MGFWGFGVLGFWGFGAGAKVVVNYFNSEAGANETVAKIQSFGGEAIAVKAELNDAMMEYGYDIIKTLVTDIDPDAQVKAAMNRINASEREKIAAQFEGDAARILIVEKAKAEAESKRLQGQGIADQRREIARGLEESVEVLNKVGINSQEASALIVVTQHYDTLQAIGEETNSNLILLPNSPQAGSRSKDRNTCF